MSQQIQSGQKRLFHLLSDLALFTCCWIICRLHACMGDACMHGSSRIRLPDMHAGEQRCSSAGDYLREAPQGHVRRSSTDAGKYTASVLTGKKHPVSLLICVLVLNDATFKGHRSCLCPEVGIVTSHVPMHHWCLVRRSVSKGRDLSCSAQRQQPPGYLRTLNLYFTLPSFCRFAHANSS